MALKRSHLSERVRAYCKTGSYELQVIVGAHGEDSEDKQPSEHEYGWKPMWLRVSTPRKYVYLHLTGMTEEELLVFKEVIDLGIADALKIVRDLDEQALKRLADPLLEEVPLRALSSKPPFFVREVELGFKAVEAEEEPSSIYQEPTSFL